MMRRPVLSSYWDERRQAVTHKITISGTKASLLFTDETLADLYAQISAAMKADTVARPH